MYLNYTHICIYIHRKEEMVYQLYVKVLLLLAS